MQGWFWMNSRALTLFVIWTSLIQEGDNNSNGGCSYGKVRVGNNCTDCPVGYFGESCTDKCTPPSYGELCSDVCDCTLCHHIFGCNETGETTDAKTTEDMKSETTVTYVVINVTNQTILGKKKESLQSTSKHVTSGSPVPLALNNTRNKQIRSKSEFFKL